MPESLVAELMAFCGRYAALLVTALSFLAAAERGLAATGRPSLRHLYRRVELGLLFALWVTTLCFLYFAHAHVRSSWATLTIGDQLAIAATLGVLPLSATLLSVLVLSNP